MNVQPDKPWSAPMKVALLALSAVGAAVCVLSAMTVIKEGSLGSADVVRMIGGALWTTFALSLRRHPEWKRYLEEKF